DAAGRFPADECKKSPDARPIRFAPPSSKSPDTETAADIRRRKNTCACREHWPRRSGIRQSPPYLRRLCTVPAAMRSNLRVPVLLGIWTSRTHNLRQSTRRKTTVQLRLSKIRRPGTRVPTLRSSLPEASATSVHRCETLRASFEIPNGAQTRATRFRGLAEPLHVRVADIGWRSIPGKNR